MSATHTMQIKIGSIAGSPTTLMTGTTTQGEVPVMRIDGTEGSIAKRGAMAEESIAGGKLEDYR